MTFAARAPDGAVVSVGAPFEFQSPLNFHVQVASPTMGRSLPFVVFPTRTLADFDALARTLPQKLGVSDVREASLYGKRLATARVEMPQYFGDVSVVRWAAWEGATGCLTTSMVNRTHDDLVSVFASLVFRETTTQYVNGLVFDSGIDNSVRPLSGLTFLNGVGFVEVQPAIPEVLARVPSGAGLQVAGGALYRLSATSDAVLLVGNRAVTTVIPQTGSKVDVVKPAGQLVVSWG